MRFCGLICALLLFVATHAFAQGQTRLVQMDSRGDMLGWEAVGRVDLQGSFCTGVLIASDLVLTAAHCLYDDRTGKLRDASNAIFRSGYLQGQSLSERRIEKYVIAEGYRHEGEFIQTSMVPHDVALLRLESPIFTSEADPFWVYADALEDVENVQVMSYGRGRAEAMSWQRQCNKLGHARDVILFDCDITFGSSGAPVFVKHGTRVRILSLVSGMSRDRDGNKRVLGMTLGKTVDRLRQRMRYGDAPALQVGQGAKRLTVGQRSSSGGAKFLKP